MVRLLMFTHCSDRNILLNLIEITLAMSDVAGWGAQCEGCSATDILRFVTVPVISNAQCNTQYGGMITAGMLCAGFPEGGRDACQMDSGKNYELCR